VTEIGMDTFSSCTALKEVDLGAGLKKISDNAFYGCTALEEITLPASLTTIYEKIFAKCSSLTRVIFEKTEGWTINKNPVDPAVFATPEAAAEALKNTYSNYIWSNKG
jgi:hypothetical protein